MGFKREISPEDEALMLSIVDNGPKKDYEMITADRFRVQELMLRGYTYRSPEGWDLTQKGRDTIVKYTE